MALIAQRDLEGVTGWRREALTDLAQRLAQPSDFPCTFSQNAFARGLLDFAFVETWDDQGRAAAAADLSEYVAASRRWDGRVDSARPLLMVFAEAAADTATGVADGLAAHHAFGWRALQDLHALDKAPWPEGVAETPEAPFWSFAFDGMQLFVNMSSPFHETRRSRNLGGRLAFVINPRERFDIVAGDTPAGARVRARIRGRIEAYDGQPHAPQLGHFLKGELEWPQYALPDRNAPGPARCPFRQRRDAAPLDARPAKA